MALVVSVNVARPREVSWEGKLVATSIWKLPVDGRIKVEKLGLVGDEQADKVGHGGEHRAVMVYQLDSYRYWESFLNRPSFKYGQFGENLTVEGLADTRVCIGDRFRIGTALFEITQPRVTCFKVGIKLDEPQMPALMVAHRRPGFYLRVIEEGEISAGDAITKVSAGPEAMTVADIDTLLYTRPRSRDALLRALRIPALSEGWRKSFESYLEEDNSDANPATVADMTWKGYRSFKIMELTRESADVLSIAFASPDGAVLPLSAAGQYVALQLQTGKDTPPAVMTYSLSGPRDDYQYRISVRLQGGAGTRYIHRHLRVGDLVKVSSPRGDFVLVSGNRPVVLISAGIGITPLLAMLYSLAAASDHDEREVWWLHSARNSAHQVFAQEVEFAGSRIPAFHRFVFYSRPGEHDRLGDNYNGQGRMNADALSHLGLPRDADYYVCGPSSFMSDVRAALETSQIDSSQIHEEQFDRTPADRSGVPPSRTAMPDRGAPDARPAANVDVTFSSSGLTVKWDSRLGSLLELAETHDIPTRWACRAGVCHSCECNLLGGELKYSPEPLDEPPAGRALICCSTPLTNVRLEL
jgi:ferredoxin-NADP reductase/MOSC domain-containing protein YiiM/ferredoxin